MLVFALCFLATTWADKLSPGYVPPAGAVGAGGGPGDLSVPFLPPGAAPGAGPEVVPILSYSNSPNTGDGSYSYSYETGDGISAKEEGVQKEAPEGPGTAAQGAFSYTGPDGVVYTVIYTADENGFVAKGDHLPTPPPVPAEIQAALEAAALEAAQAPATDAPAAQPAYYNYKSAPSYNQNYNFNKQYNTKQSTNRYYNRNFNRRF